MSKGIKTIFLSALSVVLLFVLLNMFTTFHTIDYPKYSALKTRTLKQATWYKTGQYQNSYKINGVTNDGESVSYDVNDKPVIKSHQIQLRLYANRAFINQSTYEKQTEEANTSNDLIRIVLVLAWVISIVAIIGFRQHNQ